MPACALDDAGRDRPAGIQCPVVVQELALVCQVADARVGSGAPAAFQSGGVGLGGDLCGGPVAIAGQHGEGLDCDPVLGSGIAGLVETPRSTPDVLKDMDDIDHYVNRDAAAGGLGADQVQLVLGAIDEDDPGPQVAGSRASASPDAAAITSAGSRRTEPASHLPRAFGPGRGARVPCRPPGGAMMSCGRRFAGSAS